MELKLIEKNLRTFKEVTILKVSEKEIIFTETRSGYEWTLSLLYHRYQLESKINDTHFEFLSISDVTDFLFC